MKAIAYTAIVVTIVGMVIQTFGWVTNFRGPMQMFGYGMIVGIFPIHVVNWLNRK